MTCASASCPRVINQSDLIGFMIAPLPLKIINRRGSATAELSSSSTIVDQALAPASLSNPILLINGRWEINGRWRVLGPAEAPGQQVIGPAEAPGQQVMGPAEAPGQVNFGGVSAPARSSAFFCLR